MRINGGLPTLFTIAVVALLKVSRDFPTSKRGQEADRMSDCGPPCQAEGGH